MESPSVPTLTLAFKGKMLHVYPLKEGLITIGREPSCDIHIDSLAIQPQHARILMRDGSCKLQDTGSNDVFVNHKLISEHVLEDNDLIRIGKHTLRYSLDDAIAEASPAIPAFEAAPTSTAADVNNPPKTRQRGWIQVLSGSNLGKTIKLRAGLTDLGKMDLVPALISHRREGYFISNLGENSKFSVANQEIGDKIWLLKDGDVIQSGKLQLQFYLQEDS